MTNPIVRTRIVIIVIAVEARHIVLEHTIQGAILVYHKAVLIALPKTQSHIAESVQDFLQLFAG